VVVPLVVDIFTLRSLTTTMRVKQGRGFGLRNNRSHEACHLLIKQQVLLGTFQQRSRLENHDVDGMKRQSRSSNELD
jgi:hypothetical protein